MKKYLFIIIAASLFFLVVGIFSGIFIIAPLSNSDYIPELEIKGDIENAYTLDNLDIIKKSGTINFNGKKIKAASLNDLIANANPLNVKSSIFLIGDDGRVSQINYGDIEESYISFSAESGWEAINLNHPINANTKELKEIVIVSDIFHPEIGINVISPVENIFNINPGRALLESTNYLNNLGNTSLEKDNKEFNTSIYSQGFIYDLEKILGSYSCLLLTGNEGQYLIEDNFGYIEVADNHFNYLDSSYKNSITRINGILIDPPVASNMDAFHDSMHYISNGKKVMVFLLDGFGYHQYQYAASNGYAPYMGTLKGAVMATSVYKPVTSSGLAAIITGKPPYENGIYSRDQREPKVPTIFGALTDMGKNPLYIEGNIQILKTEVEPELNTDTNQNGTSDDEIFYSALRNFEKGYDYILVHSHSIDDSGHNCGDLSVETMETIMKIDSYVEKLVNSWDGKVIITSDHGMHSTNDRRSHGEFRFEDMIIPYILTDGNGDK